MRFPDELIEILSDPFPDPRKLQELAELLLIEANRLEDTRRPPRMLAISGIGPILHRGGRVTAYMIPDHEDDHVKYPVVQIELPDDSQANGYRATTRPLQPVIDGEDIMKKLEDVIRRENFPRPRGKS